MSELDQCENCGHNIGKLEKSFVWKESVVCAECFQRLKQIDEIAPSEPEEMSIPASEFEKPLPPAVEVSTWSPKEAALLERAQRDRKKQNIGEDSKPMPSAIKSLIVVGIFVWILGGLFLGTGIGWLGVGLTAIGLIGWVVWVATGKK
jgi:hypothetical protein